MAHLIAPSMLAADFNNLGKDIQLVNESETDWFHIDVMDGVFVPNISYGMPVIKAMQKLAQKPLDVHVMIVDPDKYIETFAELGAAVLTVHYEACTHLHRTCQKIRSCGMKAGVALNPHTPVSVLEDMLDMVDLVLVMSVNPGFGGQKFIENTYKKIERLRMLREEGSHSFLIEVDGGVDTSNVKRLVEAGADALVAGSAVFASEDPMQTISKLKNPF
jgi:ribulose-phosphate 3-epimerase